MQLEQNEVHIWSSDLFLNAEQEKSQLTLLNADEYARAKRFRFPIHQRRFIAARSLLRQILSLYLDVPAQAIQFDYNEYHKPFLAQNKLNLQFNLAHSQDLAVYAITLNQAIGVDIEKIDEAVNLGIAKRYFTPQEQAALFQLPTAKRSHGFFRIWSYKEAFIKAIGKGLNIPLSSFSVSLTDEAQTIAYDNENWFLLPLTISSDYQSAFACKKIIKTVSYWNYFDQSSKLDKVTKL